MADAATLRTLGLDDAAYTDDAFLVLRGKHKSRARVRIPFEDVGGRCEITCEHGLAADANVQMWQKRLDPLWGKLAGGCHLSRDIPQLLREARLRCDNLRSGYLPHAPRFASYLFQGSAIVDE